MIEFVHEMFQRAQAAQQAVERDPYRGRAAKPFGRASSTPRQREIVPLVALGLNNQEIANRLFISVQGVETHLARMHATLSIEREAVRPDRVRLARLWWEWEERS